MKRVFFFLLFVYITLPYCKKNNQDNPFKVSLESISGNYRLIAATAGGIDVFSNQDTMLNYFKSCMKDDIYRFNAGNVLQVEDAGQVCIPTTSDTGSWSLLNPTKLAIDGEEAIIKFFDGQKLLLTREINDQMTEFTFIK
jgi:hypothetical protein